MMSVVTSQLPPPPMQHHPPPRGPPRFPPPSHFNNQDHHGGQFMPRPRLGYQPYRPFPRAPHPHAASSTPGGDNVEYDGRRLRKSLVRKTVDYNAAIVKYLQAHKEAVRGLTFSPSDQKFASCSDDGTVRVWDFYTCYEEKVLRGHGADVKSVDWHPYKGIIVSGSKDNQQPIKLWDPKAGISLCTIHAHKSTVMDTRWNSNGNWLITASRDHLIKLFDIRKLNQEMQVFRGHKKEASCIAWHPKHESLFASGGSDGSIMFWNVGCEKEIGSIEAAHDNIIWTLAWHPVGHILCSGSNDHTSKFWTRQKPGDLIRDKGHGSFHDYGALDDNEMEEAFIPGMGPEDSIETQEKEKESETDLIIPGLDLNDDSSASRSDKPAAKKTPYQKPIPKKFQAIWNDTKVELVDDELDDERGRNPLLPRMNERVNSGSASLNEKESSTNVGGGVDAGGGGGNIFDPNIGFGPMGAQYNLPVPPHAMGNPFFTQQPPTGPSPFLNHSNNPFWNPPTNQAPGNNPNRQGQVRPGGGRGRASRGGGGNNSSRGGWNR
ncbi:Flowering time control protein FY [Folsomia candida]|uniref:Flowering time control protein FY n=1 Tax=Folsomia candida TaxID=158441 RepID=A0A226EHX9_FOLCA|nr:Flowering time control protein FY [Folsomia candida]